MGVLLASVGFGGGAPAVSQEPAAQADFVFVGTVRLLNSSTVSTEDVAGLAVVRLDEVVAGPVMLRSFVGKDITVRLQTPSAVKEGEERVFYANSWIFGDSIGVIEVSSQLQTRAQAMAGDLAGAVTKARAGEADRQLKAKLERTTLVVVGRVSAIKPSQRPILSEHDPHWSEAEIVVSEVLKGSAQGNVTMAFPASTDVMWYKAPKPKVGQDGVFLLSAGLSGLAADRVGVTEAQDVLPASEIARVKALLGR
jgi:hypothetical protein